MSENRIAFTEDDERKLASAAQWGKIVAITSMISGVLSILTMFTTSVDGFALGIAVGSTGVGLALAVLLYQASSAFGDVATTDVADHAYLLEGFKKLRVYFMVQVLLVLIGLGFALFGVIVAAALSA